MKTLGCRRFKTANSVITVSYEDIQSGWERWILLRSDAHHDNAHAQHDLERQHLEEAKQKDAQILDFGDLFCAMQGKWDKRADETQMRPELRGTNYLDKLVAYNAKFYKPFAKNFLLVGQGNHETNILRRHQTDLTGRFVELLNADRDREDPAFACGFSGWVRFKFKRSNEGYARLLKFHHGYGGDAPVTRGVIQTARMGVYLPDADFVVTGHNHHEYVLPIERERITSQGVLFKDTQWHIKCPGYKDEYADGSGGWSIERGAPPKPIGAIWLRFYLKHGNKIMSELTAAK